MNWKLFKGFPIRVLTFQGHKRTLANINKNHFLMKILNRKFSILLMMTNIKKNEAIE